MSAYPYRRRSPSSTPRNTNLFGNFCQTDELSASMDTSYYPTGFRPANAAMDGPLQFADHSTDYNDLNFPAHALGFPSNLRVDAAQARNREEYTTRGSVGTQQYHAHGSISDAVFAWPSDGDLALHSLSTADEDLLFPPQRAVSPLREARNAVNPYQRRYHAGVENAYHPSYQPESSRGYRRAESAAPPPSRFQSPVSSRFQSPASTRFQPPAPPPPPPPAATHDFVHMNDTFIATDLPADSPFALVAVDPGVPSFAGHPYPDGHQWPQTFKITQVKQIGPKKQTLACFFCRSRKIACAPKAVDGVDDRTCEQCERRGIACEYPKESKRGQHNRIRSPNAQGTS